MESQAAHWLTVAHLSRWTELKINSLVSRIYNDHGSTLADFFSLGTDAWIKEYNLDHKDVQTLLEARYLIPENSFLADNLFSQGFDIIPLTNPDYPKTLRDRLKLAAPPVLYVRGDRKLLNEDSLTVYGPVKASPKALRFTEAVARTAAAAGRMLVSGTAKGAGKAALDCALKHKGRGIVVLAQGVLTFGFGYRAYARQVQKGDILFVSALHPRAPRKSGHDTLGDALVRNLANHFYVAEAFAQEAPALRELLKKGRALFVRIPQPGEKAANSELIVKGAIPVDMLGRAHYPTVIRVPSPPPETAPPASETPEIASFNRRILSLLTETSLTANEICAKLDCGWSAQKMSVHLRALAAVQMEKQGKVNLYSLRSVEGDQRTIDDFLAATGKES